MLTSAYPLLVLPDILIMGTHLWDRLLFQEKKWMEQAVDSSIVYQRKLWIEAEKEALDEVKKAGVKIIYPNKKLFSDEVKDVYSALENDKEISQIIKEIQNTN
jgi:TRAP-type C4-dicarboxylate transport system substrate-binding protein